MFGPEALIPSSTVAVDVAIITYNQEAYIAQAVDSVIAQETTFPVRLIIGEDCSTDNTRRILQQYQQRYPDRIRLLLPEQNIGVMANLKAVLEACRAPYVALLEGDDYWTDVTKLQQQVTFLESSPAFSMSFHDAEIFWDNNQTPPYRLSETKPQLQAGAAEFSHADVVRNGWFVPTASIVYRRSALPAQLPEWLLHVFSGDYSLHLLISAAGKMQYLPKVMSRYRQHMGGISKQKDDLARILKKIQENKTYLRHFGAEHASQFRHNVSSLYAELAEYFLQQRNYVQAVQKTGQALLADPLQTLRWLIRRLGLR